MHGPLNVKSVKNLFYSYFLKEIKNVINNVTNMFKCIMTKGAKNIHRLDDKHLPFSQCSLTSRRVGWLIFHFMNKVLQASWVTAENSFLKKSLEK